MTVIYLDTSVAVRTILDVPQRRGLQQWMQSETSTFVSSRLLRTEVVRVMRRERRPLTDAAALLDRVGLIDLRRETHAVAESIEKHVKTLDALHLATAVLLGDGVTVASHDSVMLTVAEHLGLAVTDPVADLS